MERDVYWLESENTVIQSFFFLMGNCQNVFFLRLYADVWPLFSVVFFFRDLSENFIQSIPRKAFRGAVDIKNL